VQEYNDVPVNAICRLVGVPLQMAEAPDTLRLPVGIGFTTMVMIPFTAPTQSLFELVRLCNE
jgi:hypothetical protein